VRGSRRSESHSTADATRVERRADARRQRAMSHLERIRGQTPRRAARPPRLTGWGGAALVFGEHSKLVSRGMAAYMSRLMGPQAPIVEVPEAQHHVFLDQPLGFVASLRALLDGWSRA